MTVTEMVSTQNRIISLQSEIIDGLYTLLSQHLSMEGAEALPEIEKIGTAVQLRRKIGEE